MCFKFSISVFTADFVQVFLSPRHTYIDSQSNNWILEWSLYGSLNVASFCLGPVLYPCWCFLPASSALTTIHRLNSVNVDLLWGRTTIQARYSLIRTTQLLWGSAWSHAAALPFEVGHWSPVWWPYCPCTPFHVVHDCHNQRVVMLVICLDLVQFRVVSRL